MCFVTTAPPGQCAQAVNFEPTVTDNCDSGQQLSGAFNFKDFLLIAQATLGVNLLGRPVPTSLIQLWVPRVELHLFYNTIVFIPMVIGMYYHLFPPAEESAKVQCTCAWHRGATA